MPAEIGVECLQAVYEWGLTYGRLGEELTRPREGRAREVAIDMHFGNTVKALADMLKDCPLSRGAFKADSLTTRLGQIQKTYPDRERGDVLDKLDELANDIKHHYLKGVGGEEWDIQSPLAVAARR